MYLSSWELNRKTPHPKYLEKIIEYLGYIPKLKSKFDRLGSRTKLYRIKNDLSLKEFLKMSKIDVSLIKKIEEQRFNKLSKYQVKGIEKALSL